MTDINDISFLKAKQEAMAEDIREVKEAIRDIATAMTAIAAIEQKIIDQHSTTLRLHARIDSIEERVTATEVKAAAQMWIERVIWVVLTGVLATFWTSTH